MKSLFDILVDSVVCVEKTANQKPMNIAVNQWENKEIPDIQNQEIKQFCKKFKSAHCWYQDQAFGIVDIQHKSSQLRIY